MREEGDGWERGERMVRNGWELDESWVGERCIGGESDVVFLFASCFFFVSLHLIPIGRKSTRGATSDCG